jgi:hypothetical protein
MVTGEVLVLGNKCLTKSTLSQLGDDFVASTESLSQTQVHEVLPKECSLRSDDLLDFCTEL